MAIGQVQVSPLVITGGSGATSTTFGTLPAAGALIRVVVSMLADLGSENVTVADNQGNTYTLAIDSGNINNIRTQLWYAYDVAAVGTFTVTATALGSNQTTVIQAKEASGFGAADPLTGTASAVGNSINPSVGPSAPFGTAEALVDAVINSYAASSLVEVVSPTWDVDSATGGWQTDSRIVTDMAGQTCSWSLSSGVVWAAALAVFTPVPLASDADLDQMGRHTLLTAEGTARLTQIGRRVLFVFTTCGATPPPLVTETVTIRRERRFLLPSSPDNKNVQIPTLELLMRTGIGLTPAAWDGANVPQGANPQVMMRISKDGGKTWGPERWRSAGAIGRYLTRVRWLRATGNYRNAVMEIVVTDPVDWQLLAVLGTPIEGSS